MKKNVIGKITILLGLIIVAVFLFIPEVGSTSHPPNWHLVAKTKLRSLGILYTTYTEGASNARYRPLDTIEELKEFAIATGADLSIFSTYDPLHRKETPVLYFKPKTFTEDELVFVFREPILPTEKKSYTEIDMILLRYAAIYTESGITFLESKPTELKGVIQAQ